MTTITLEAIEAKQSELSSLIEQYRAAAQGSIVELPSAKIQLRPGERYAGLSLDDDGKPMCHLILLPTFVDDIDWEEAGDWAESQGGDLPTRREQALLYANCKPHLQPRWHWSGQPHESEASYAWLCCFGNGSQTYGRKGAKACAVAVRRVTV